MRLLVFIAFSLCVFVIAPGGSSAAVLGGSIEYTKSGGIAGIEESMKIDRNGKGRIERTRFTLSTREGKRLAAAIRRADLARTSSPKSGSCCDFFQYAIRYRGRTLAWDENTEDHLPARVAELRTLLAELYERYASSQDDAVLPQTVPLLLGLPKGWPHILFPKGDAKHWKLTGIDAFAGPDRPLAWIDDAHDAACHEWARRRTGPTLLVSVEPDLGLLPEHADALREWTHSLTGWWWTA